MNSRSKLKLTYWRKSDNKAGRSAGNTLELCSFDALVAELREIMCGGGDSAQNVEIDWVTESYETVEDLPAEETGRDDDIPF